MMKLSFAKELDKLSKHFCIFSVGGELNEVHIIKNILEFLIFICQDLERFREFFWQFAYFLSDVFPQKVFWNNKVVVGRILCFLFCFFFVEAILQCLLVSVLIFK